MLFADPFAIPPSGIVASRSLVLFADPFAIPPSGIVASRSLVLFADPFAIPPSGIVAVREYGSSSPPAASLGLDEKHSGSCQSGVWPINPAGAVRRRERAHLATLFGWPSPLLSTRPWRP